MPDTLLDDIRYHQYNGNSTSKINIDLHLVPQYHSHSYRLTAERLPAVFDTQASSAQLSPDMPQTHRILQRVTVSV